MNLKRAKNNHATESWREIFVAIFFGFFVAACTDNAIQDPKSSSKKSGSVKDNRRISSEKEPAKEDGLEAVDDSNESSSDAEVAYPKFNFAGSGRANVSGISESADLKHEFNTNMTSTKLDLTTTLWTSSRKEARDAVRTWNERTEYKLDPSVDAFNDSGEKLDASKLKFLLFSSKATNNRGESVTFKPALPVLPMPSSKSRLIAGEAMGRITFKSEAKNGESFAIEAYVTVSKSSEDNFEVQIEYEIPSDQGSQRGRLYQLIPMFKSGSYNLDLASKNLTGIQASTLAYDSENKKSVTVNLNYSACSKEQSGKKEDINGGC